MVTLHERLLDPNAGSVRTAILWWAMALRRVGAIISATLAAFWPSMTWAGVLPTIASWMPSSLMGGAE